MVQSGPQPFWSVSSFEAIMQKKSSSLCCYSFFTKKCISYRYKAVILLNKNIFLQFDKKFNQFAYIFLQYNKYFFDKTILSIRQKIYSNRRIFCTIEYQFKEFFLALPMKVLYAHDKIHVELGNGGLGIELLKIN